MGGDREPEALPRRRGTSYAAVDQAVPAFINGIDHASDTRRNRIVVPSRNVLYCGDKYKLLLKLKGTPFRQIK